MRGAAGAPGPAGAPQMEVFISPQSKARGDEAGTNQHNFSPPAPCHRVIGGNGDLHGYGAGGLKVKANLLAMERGGALALA